MKGKVKWIEEDFNSIYYEKEIKFLVIYDITQYLNNIKMKHIKFYGIQEDISKINVFKITINNSDKYIVEKGYINKNNIIKYIEEYDTFDEIPLEKIINAIIELKDDIEFVEQKVLDNYENCIKQIKNNQLYKIQKQ